MSTSKKPGTDLAALKARLAKRTQGTGDAPAIPAPGEVRPEPVVPTPEAVPPPGEVSSPGIPTDLPPPGQVSVPTPYGAAASFDPNAGVIADTGGEVVSRGSKGIVLFAALLAAVFGGIMGYLYNKYTSTKHRIKLGKDKGAMMVAEVNQVISTRKDISLGMEELKKAIGEDPEKGADQVTAMMTENFDKHPQVDELFGWQLASVHSIGIKKTFDLYEEANGLKLDLGYLAGFLTEYGAAMKEARGPALFGLLFKKEGAVLVYALGPVCNLEEKSPCAEGEENNAVGYLVREALGSQPFVVPKGAVEGSAIMLRPEGNVYAYYFNLKQEENALKVYASLLKKVENRLEAMAKAEGIAIKALKRYSDDPTVDDTNPQPEPSAE